MIRHTNIRAPLDVYITEAFLAAIAANAKVMSLMNATTRHVIQEMIREESTNACLLAHVHVCILKKRSVWIRTHVILACMKL
jgi:hypothetical protein